MIELIGMLWHNIITVNISDTTRMTAEQRELGFLVMEVLATLLSNSNQNTSKYLFLYVEI
jgi:hypothetical protein